MELFVVYLILGVLCGALGYSLSNKGDEFMGGLLGFLLGPIGVLIVAVMKKK